MSEVDLSAGPGGRFQWPEDRTGSTASWSSFDDPKLVPNAVCYLATLVVRLGLEPLIDTTVRLGRLVGRARRAARSSPWRCHRGRRQSHIDHADMLRAGATKAVFRSGDGSLDAGHVGGSSRSEALIDTNRAPGDAGGRDSAGPLARCSPWCIPSSPVAVKSPTPT